MVDTINLLHLLNTIRTNPNPESKLNNSKDLKKLDEAIKLLTDKNKGKEADKVTYTADFSSGFGIFKKDEIKKLTKDKDCVIDIYNDKIKKELESKLGIKLKEIEIKITIDEYESSEIDDNLIKVSKKLEEAYKDYYQVYKTTINGVEIRAPYPNEVGKTSLIKDGKKILIEDKNSNSKDLYEKYIEKKKKEIIQGPKIKGNNILSDIDKALEEKSKDFLTQSEIDTLKELKTKLTSITEDKDTTITIDDIKVHPIFYNKEYKINVPYSKASEIVETLNNIGTPTILRKKDVDEEKIVHIRRKLKDESIESYERAIRENYISKKVFSDKMYKETPRIRYPHERPIDSSDDIKLKNGTTIKFDDGLTAKECFLYYKNDYLSSITKKTGNMVTIFSKEDFVKEMKKIVNIDLFTTYESYTPSVLQSIIALIEADTLKETSDEMGITITIDMENFPAMQNKKYKFRIKEETLQKLENDTKFNELFPSNTIVKENKPIIETIRIRKRKDSETIEEYEKYLKDEVYKDYPSSSETIDDIRTKYPHEEGKKEFQAEGKKVLITYGDATKEETEDSYKNSVIEHYQKYYKEKIKAKLKKDKTEKNKSDFIDLLNKIIAKPTLLVATGISIAELKQLKTVLMNDPTKQDLTAKDIHQLSIDGSTILGETNTIYKINISESTYPLIKDTLNKYFPKGIKFVKANTSKNSYIKEKLKEKLASISGTTDEDKKLKDLIKKALKILDFDIEKTTDEKTELLGAVVKTNDKEEFISTMIELEKMGFVIQNFVPVEKPRAKKDSESVKKYETYLKEHYKGARPGFSDENNPAYIYDTTTHQRKPYPHEIFAWTDEDTPSINEGNISSDDYSYYIHHGKNSLLGRRKVTSKSNIKDRKILFKNLRNAFEEYNERFRDVTFSQKRFAGLKENMRNGLIIGVGTSIFIPGIGLPMGILSGIGLGFTATLVAKLLKVKQIYDEIKASPLDEYSKSLAILKEEITNLKREIELMSSAPSVDKHLMEIKLSQLKSSIVAYKKTSDSFNKLYNKVVKVFVEQFAQTSENINDFREELEEDYDSFIEEEEKKNKRR